MGNPAIEEQYRYMLSYSPYDNVSAQAYPPVFVIAGRHDSQVGVHEPAKLARAAARHQIQVDRANVNAVGLRQPPECKLRVN